jgi:hypothetical protein
MHNLLNSINSVYQSGKKQKGLWKISTPYLFVEGKQGDRKCFCNSNLLEYQNRKFPFI